METTIYFIRHSEMISKDDVVNLNNNPKKYSNKEAILSIDGENKAKSFSECEEMQGFDYLVSSAYVRTMSTAKYIASKNGLKIMVDERFNEREFGYTEKDGKWPEDFLGLQKENPDYKFLEGESRRDVEARMYDGLMDILNEHRGKKVAVLTHGTALTFLFMKILEYKDDKIMFDNKVLITNDFKWNPLEVFKLTFKDDVLIDVDNIRVNY